MLNAMRFGKLHPEAVAAFRNLSREVHYDDGIEPTELYPTRAEVESANSSRLNKLPGNPILFRARDLPGRDAKGECLPPQRVERALKDVIAPEKLNLKIGAQVMLIKNIIQGVLVNGSVGRVVGFYKPRDALKMGIEIALPDRRERNEPDVPLRAIDEPGNTNPTTQRTQPTQPAPTAPTGSQAPDARAQRIQQILQLNTIWPAVQFENGPTQLCVPLTFEVVNAEGMVEAVRDQVPLILAIFEKGQAYVALSRATRMETLQVVNFDPARVLAHPRVLQWMSEHTGKYNGPEYIQERDLDEELEYWRDFL
ncbi:hypothetical protein C8Q79DRAFT_38298 [Trametes meyenii]|nr:hypothetical protein C8Q79DRAFT_38298 [Trametes meyenii]